MSYILSGQGRAARTALGRGGTTRPRAIAWPSSASAEPFSRFLRDRSCVFSCISILPRRRLPPSISLQVSVNDVPLGVSDHRPAAETIMIEWPVPPKAISGSRAVVTMEFHTADERVDASVRCPGNLCPARIGPGAGSETAATDRAMCLEPSIGRGNWNRRIACREALWSESEKELESKVAWAHSLEAELEKTRRYLANLQGEFDDRTAWALKMDAELKATHAELHRISGSFWYQLGKKLRLIPAPHSKLGRQG